KGAGHACEEAGGLAYAARAVGLGVSSAALRPAQHDQKRATSTRSVLGRRARAVPNLEASPGFSPRTTRIPQARAGFCAIGARWASASSRVGPARTPIRLSRPCPTLGVCRVLCE